MSVSLGELVIDLVLDTEDLQAQFDAVYEQSLMNASRIEDAIKQHTQTIDIALKIDDQQLKDLKQLAEIGISLESGIAAQGVSTSPASSAHPKGDTEAIAIAVGEAVKESAPRGGIGGMAGTALIAGALEPLTAKFGHSLQRSLDGALSGLLGSSDLLAESLLNKLIATMGNSGEIINNLFESAIEDLPRHVQVALRDAKEEIEEGLKEDFDEISETVRGAIDSVIPESERLQEALRVRGQQRTNTEERMDPARKEYARERRDRFRQMEERKSELRQAEKDRDDFIAAKDKAENLRDKIFGQYEALAFELTLAKTPQEIDENIKDSDELTKVLEDINKWLEANEETLKPLEAAVKAAEEAFEKSKEDVKLFDGQMQELKPKVMPKMLRDALKAVLGDRQISESQIPRVVVDDDRLEDKEAESSFDIDTNTIFVKQDLLKALSEGKATVEQIETILEELQHAFDFDFGSFEGVDALSRKELLRPIVAATAKETQAIGDELGQYDPELRDIEGNAKIMAKRLSKNVADQEKARQLAPQFEKRFGVGGTRFKEETKKDLSVIIGQVKQLRSDAENLGIDTKDIGRIEKVVGIVIDAVGKLPDAIQTRGDAQEVLKAINPVMDVFSKMNILQAKIQETKQTVESAKRDKDEADAAKKTAEQEKVAEEMSSDGLQRAQDIAARFADNYKLFKEALESGDADLIELHRKTITQLAESAKQDVTNIVKTLEDQGVDVSFGSELGSKLNNVKSQLSRKQNLIDKSTNKALADLVDADDVGSQNLDRIDLSVLRKKAKEVAATYGIDPNSGLVDNIVGMAKSPETQKLVAGGAATAATAFLGPHMAHLPAMGAHVAGTEVGTLTVAALSRLLAKATTNVMGTVADVTTDQTIAPDQRTAEIAKRTRDALLSEDSLTDLAQDSIKDIAGGFTGGLHEMLDGVPLESMIETMLDSVGLNVVANTLTGTVKTVAASVKKGDNADISPDIKENLKPKELLGNAVDDAADEASDALSSMIDDFVAGDDPIQGFLAGQAGSWTVSKVREMVEKRLASAKSQSNSANAPQSGSANAPQSSNTNVPQSTQLYRRFNQEGVRFHPDNRIHTEEEIARLQELNEWLIRVEENADRMDTALDRLDAESLDELDQSFRGLGREISNFSSMLNDPVAALERMEDSVPAFELIPKSVRKIGIAIAGFAAFMGFGSLISDLAIASFDAALSFERLQTTFKFVEGSADSAAKQIARIREESQRLGVDAESALSGYAQLASASRGTTLEGAATEQMSAAMQQAAAVSQLSSEQLAQANTAVAQISGKGKLSTEELRQQLAEVGGVFSGSFSIAARAMGVTTSELDRMLQRGEVLSEEFLPKFAQQLSAETASGVAGAANSAQAAINRFNNKLTELKEAIGEPLVVGRKTFLTVGVELLEKLIDLAPIAISLISGLAAKLSLDMLGGAGTLLAPLVAPAFSEFDIDKGKSTTFGDRVVDTAIAVGRVDVKDVGADALDLFKAAASDASDMAVDGFNRVRDSWDQMTNAFRQRNFGDVSLDQLSRGGVGVPSMIQAQPSFGDLSFEELAGGTDIKPLKTRFADMSQQVRGHMAVIRDGAIATAKTMQASLVTSAKNTGKAIASSSRAAAVSVLNIGKASVTAAISLGQMAASLLASVAPMLAMTAAIEGFKLGMKFFSDLRGEMGEMVDASEDLAKSLDIALEKLKALQEGRTAEVGAATEEEAIANQDSFYSEIPLVGKWLTDFGEMDLGAEIQEKLPDQIEVPLEFLYRITPGAKAPELYQQVFGGFDRLFKGRSYEAKQQAHTDRMLRFESTIAASEDPALLEAASRVSQIDDEVRSLNAQYGSTSDLAEKQAIQSQIDNLTSERSVRSEGIATTQSTLAADMQSAKDALKLYEEKLESGALTQEDYSVKVGETEGYLNRMEQRLESLGDAIATVRSPLMQMNDALSEAAAIASDMDLARAIEDAQAQLDLAQQQGTMGDQAFSMLSVENDIERIKREIESVNQARAGIQSGLDEAAIDQSFRNLAGAGISREMSPNELIDALNKTGLGDDNTDVQTLQAFAEKGIELQQLEAEALTLNADLVTSQADLRQQAKDLAREYRDLTRQISDFYRDAYRSAEDVAGQIVSQDFQNATQEISNRIQRELMGLEDSFVSGIGDTFVGLIESLRQPMLDELEAIGERNTITREFEDQLRAANELQLESDRFDFNAGLGPDPDANLPAPSAIGGTEDEDYITDAQGRRWPKVIDIPALGFGGGHFLGEESHENQPIAPIAIPQNPAIATNAQSTVEGIRNDDIAAATDLARRGRDYRLDAVDRNLATQADTASLEADKAIAGITRQLEEGRRTISEQTQSFERSLRDIGAEIGKQNPMRELERSLLAVHDQFTDTNRDLEQFKRGLQDTITETSTVRQQLLEGVAAGTIGQDALAMLPDLDQTIAESQAALTQADAQIDQNRDLLEAQRSQIIKDFEDAEKDRRREAQIRALRGRQDIRTQQVANIRPSLFNLDEQAAKQRTQLINEARGQAIDIALQFDADTRELDDLLETGELTKGEYAALKDNLIEVSELRLDGLKSQFEDMLPTVEAIASALGATKGEVNQDAFAQIRENLNKAAQSGALSEEQVKEARAGLLEAQSIANTRGENEAIRALINTDNAFTSQFLSQAGRSDLTNIADLGRQNRQAEQAQRDLASLNTDPEALAAGLTQPELAQPNNFTNVFAESSDRMVLAMENLTKALSASSEAKGGVTVQQQNVTVSRDEEAIARRAVDELNRYMEQKL